MCVVAWDARSNREESPDANFISDPENDWQEKPFSEAQFAPLPG